MTITRKSLPTGGIRKRAIYLKCNLVIRELWVVQTSGKDSYGSSTSVSSWLIINRLVT